MSKFFPDAKRLSGRTIETLPTSIRRPAYGRSRLEPGIVHLGVGAFHRCHQAEYTDDALEAAFGPWGIIGINLRPPAISAALDDQDGYYCRELRNNGAVERRLIGSMLATVSVLGNSEDPAGLTLETALRVAADARIKVITLTVTEKGYCHIPATGALDENHPDIVHDIAHPERPLSVPGFLIQVLARRFSGGLPAPVIISCDNVPDNGTTLRRCVLALAARIDATLRDRIDAEVSFLNTMVDRIVPATMPEYLDRFAEETGLRDEGLVAGEPYRMWVVERHGNVTLPPWDRAGALYVDDVVPYEILKMRVVNGIQSNLCQLGLLSGIDFMSGVMADNAFAAFAHRTIAEEVIPHLPDVGGIDMRRYLDETVERLKNADLKHRTSQISTDSSLKIRQRLLEPIRAALKAGTPCDGLLIGVAGWMQYAGGRDWRGGAIDVRDPLAATTTAIGERHRGDPRAMVSAFLDLDVVFGRDFRENLAISEKLAAILGQLQRAPARQVVADFMSRF